MAGRPLFAVDAVDTGEMRRSTESHPGSTDRSARIETATTLAKHLIQEPVRRAVRDALAEEKRAAERNQEDAHHEGKEDTHRDVTTGGRTRRRQAFGVALAVLAVALIVGRRSGLLDRTSLRDRGGTGTATDRTAPHDTTVVDERTSARITDDERTVQS
ncbi:hypothetical protein [Halobellus sp. GM3]|uniref:hypothetical protein n=1 Tax=Halobellus sp. GM3 TaxID=3458410 RepID=UPI00403E2C17